MREKFEAVLLRDLVYRSYAPTAQVRSLGRAATLLVLGGEVTLLFHHRRIIYANRYTRA